MLSPLRDTACVGERAQNRRVPCVAAAIRAPRPAPGAFVWLVVVGCVVAAAMPAGALAHAYLVRAQPADGTAVAAAPVAVRLFFNSAIHAEPGMRAVRDTGGSVLDGRVRVVGGRELVIPLRHRLPRGAYTVLWRVLSEDGHPVAGTTTFAVGAGQARPRPVLTAPSEPRVLPGFERWVFLGGVLLAVGLSIFRIAMPREAAPSLRVLCASFLLAASGGAALVERASLSTRFGVVAAAAVGVACAGALASLLAGLFSRLAYGAWLCGIALVVAPSAAGHALDPGRSRIELPADVLHVAGSSVWLGGVVALTLGARDAYREHVLRRFSVLALAAVAIIGATGLVRAFGELSAFEQVWATSYGRLLIVKTVLFAALVILGWANRYRFIPALARSAHGLRRNLGAEIMLLLVLIGAVALLTQSRPGRDRGIAEPIPTAVRARAAPQAPREAVVLAQAGRAIQLAGAAANALSIDGTSVLWETLPGEASGSAALVDRNLLTRRMRTVARNVAPLYGLASTTTSIVYATATVPVRLVALDRRSGRLVVLSDSLAVPFAWRGDRVAWAEAAGTRQRVVVYNLRRHETWTGADLPSCVGGLCYRLDAVTLADDGVAFVRSAIGSETSSVVRRAFAAPRPDVMRIEQDPQPDLVPSATGVLYYALDRGWYRWDFGVKRPRRVGALAARALSPIAYDGEQWLLLQHRGCDDAVVAGLNPTRTATLASPARAHAVAAIRTGVCVRLESLTWAGKRPVTTWIVVPRASHSAGATAVIVVGRSAHS